jgi:hypothetical protein
MAETAHLKLPVLEAGQAQKHVTVNEALAMLDALVQPSVLDADRTMPPASPAEGDRHIVAAGGAGAWSGRDHRIAVRSGGAWVFHDPAEGWQVWDQSADASLRWTSAAWSGAVSLPAGSAAAPAIALGGGGTGLFGKAAGQLGIATGGAQAGWIDHNGLHVGTPSSSFAGSMHAYRTGGDSVAISLQGEAASGVIAYRMSANSSGPIFQLYKGRGSWAAAAFPNAGDVLGDFLFGMLSSASSESAPIVLQAARMRARAVATSPSATDAESEIVFALCGAGSTTLADTVAIRRSTGVSYDGGVVIDQNRILRDRVYALAGLPAPGTAGRNVGVSDLGGGAGRLYDNGAAWVRLGDGGHGVIATDAPATLTVLTSAVNIRHTGTLTADRTIALSASNTYAGARFRVTRTGGGAFNLSVGGLKPLATNTWAEVVHDGTAWTLAAFGTL